MAKKTSPARDRPASDFGDRLRQALIESGKTQADLRRAVAVSKVAVSNWVMGYSWPRLDHAYAIAQCLGVALDELADEPASSSAAGRPDPDSHGKEELAQRLAGLGIGPALRQLETAVPDLLQVLDDAERSAAERGG